MPNPVDPYGIVFSDEQAVSALSEVGLIEIMNYHQKQLTLLMEHTRDAVWVVDTELQTLDINPVACHLLDWDAETVIGQCYPIAMAKNNEDGHQILVKYLEQAIALDKKISFNRGISLNLKNNQSILVEGVAYPLHEQKCIIGAAVIFRPASPNRHAEQMQADFVALASHNLRNPLMSIQTCLDYVLNANSDQEKIERLLTEARQQSQKIACFLQDLIDISKLTLNREIPLRVQAVDLSPLIKSVVADFQQDPEQKGITYQLEIPADLPPISADAAKIDLILHNLIAHAKRRSEANDIIKISAHTKEEVVIISILDNGPPISPQQYQQIFWHVYPLETNGNHNTVPYGYGLGLYSTRRLVELLGGNIWITQSSSQEACLNFSLPIWR